MTKSTILCVDDEPNVLKALRRLLRGGPYDVITCESGAEALEILNHCSPEVIISDQRMPGMTGTEFLAQVKDRHPESVRVVLSGYADAASILESINRGHIFRFLTKPWQDDDLREAIRQCVHQYDISLENRRLMEQIAEQNVELLVLNERLEEVVSLRTRSLRFAQDVLYRLPSPVVGVDATGTVVLVNDAASLGESIFSQAHVGLSAQQSLPPQIALAVNQCLSGSQDFTCIPVSEHHSNHQATVRRLTAENELRGCLVTIV